MEYAYIYMKATSSKRILFQIWLDQVNIGLVIEEDVRSATFMGLNQNNWQEAVVDTETVIYAYCTQRNVHILSWQRFGYFTLDFHSINVFFLNLNKLTRISTDRSGVANHVWKERGAQ